MIIIPSVTIQLDPADLVKANDDFTRRQLPYATALGLNAVAFDFQFEQQRHMERAFTLRRAQFVRQGIYFPREQRADYRVGRMHATVSIEPKRDFLTKFERGGWKRPRRAVGHVAVPVDARRAKSQVVSKGERIGSLDLRIHARGPKATIGRGRGRTFSIRMNTGEGYIFRRTGKGKRSTLRLLYHLRARTPIPPSLEFMATAYEVARSNFPYHMAEAFKRAARTAR